MPLEFRALDDALATVSALVGKSRAECQTAQPDLLFHYTTGAGMRGILDSSRLWGTNYRYLNDASEIGYGVSLFEELINDRLVNAKDDVLTEFLGRSLQTANAFDGMFDCYIACFCQRDDLLTQWRAYAGSGGGYALGFSTKEIGRRWGQLDRTQDFTLRKVIYEVERQKALLAQVIDQTLGVLAAGTNGISVAEANNLIARCCGFVRSEVADYLLSFKHPAFAVEEEWRICHVVSPSEEDHVQFRDGVYGLTPYVCLDISPMAGVNHNKLPLAQITHGPTPNPENVRFALSKLLRAKKYAFVQVAGSTLPVRVGA